MTTKEIVEGATVTKENGKVKRIKKDGEVLFRDENNVRRSKISEQSTQDLVNDIQNSNGDKFRRRVFEILTGKTVEEATQ